MLCDCSHSSAFVSAPGADCPCPETQVVEEIAGVIQFFPKREVFHRWYRQCASGDATPGTVLPDSSEDREGSTSAVL